MNRPPGTVKWRPLAIAGGSFIFASVSIAFYMEAPVDPSGVRMPRTTAAGEVGGAGSPRYNELMLAKNREEAALAVEQGSSFAPGVVGRDERGLGEIPPAPAAACPPCRQAPDTKARAQALTTAMTRLLGIGDLEPQAVIAVAGHPRAATPAPPAAGERTAPLPPGLRAGQVLHVINELEVRSTLPSVPVIASVVAGPLKGARLSGRFQVVDERLVVQFTQLIHNGSGHRIDALAVDPAIPAGHVASEVDRHYLLRWGSLMAGSFLEGLGATARAIADSGQTQTLTSAGVVVSRPEIDAEKQMQITLGTVGERVGAVLQENFRIPTTVTLHARQEMGVLLLEVEESRSP